MKSKLLLLLALIFAYSAAYAQDGDKKTITGTVTSAADGSPMPGVTVLVEGSTLGTTTDADGKYTIQVPVDTKDLIFRFIGFQTVEVPIGGKAIIDVSLEEDLTDLEEVVVTAQGIQRAKRSLGYGVSSVSADQIAQKPTADIARSLSGKVPGVSITNTSGVAGGGTNIIIRGYSSISGSNQPLFVIDGVPFNTATNTQDNFTGSNLNTPSRFFDLDPNNIANIQVLKGLSATLLYGEQGRNGVILVTTKTGNPDQGGKDFEVSVTESVFLTRIASLPKYQNTYGNGFYQVPGYFFSNWGADVARFKDQKYPKIDPTSSIVQHPYGQFRSSQLKAAFPEFQDKPYDYKVYPGAEKFFQTGVINNTNVSFSGRKATTSYSATFSYTDETSYVPNNKVKKFNAGLGFNTHFTKKLSLNTTLNFSSSDVSGPPLGASSGSSAIGEGIALFANVLYTPRTIDLNNLPYISPVDGRSVYYRAGNDIPNPKWLLENTNAGSITNRYYGRMILTYDIFDELSVSYRGGVDTYTENQEYLIQRGVGPGPDNENLNAGLYRTTNIANTITDHTFLVNFNKDIAQDLNLTGVLGANLRIDVFKRDGLESTGQVVHGFVEHAGFSTPSSINSFLVRRGFPDIADIQRQSEERLGAVYAQFSLDYKSYLYLNLSGRNDWSSTFESANNSILYPSASVSFIPTSAFDISNNILNYLKVRAGFGSSSGFPDPYGTRNTLSSNPRAFVTGSTIIATNTIADKLGNPDLKPELHQEFEVGIEGKFWDNRISLDGSYYIKNTTNLITELPLDPATGYRETVRNVGSIRNTGVEVALGVTALKTEDFNWDLNFNFFQYESIVTKLQDPAGFVNSGFLGFAENAIVEGEPYNVIRTTTAVKNAQGQRVVNNQGLYNESNDVSITGNPNPDFTLTGVSNLSWKNFTFSMQWDWRKGGDVFSITAAAITGRGLAGNTEFDRTQTVILPGVKVSDGETNNIQVSATDAYWNMFGFGPGEFRVFDGSTIRLREISLTYDIPKSILDKTFFGSLSVSLIGQNLFFNAYNIPRAINFDTDVLGTGVGNGLGLEFLTGASSKNYGISLKATF